MSKYRKGKSTTPPSLAAAARIRGSWRVKSIYWSSLAILYIHRYPSSWGCAPLPHRGGSHPLWDLLPGQTAGKGRGMGPLLTHLPVLAPVAGTTQELIAVPLVLKVSMGRADGHSPFQHGISFTNRPPNPNAGCTAQSQRFSCVRGGAWIRSEHWGAVRAQSAPQAAQLPTHHQAKPPAWLRPWQPRRHNAGTLRERGSGKRAQQ